MPELVYELGYHEGKEDDRDITEWNRITRNLDDCIDSMHCNNTAYTYYQL
jgi:hypothetical protein